jgi:methylthioribose-1-phosphate isomerase
MTTDYKILKNIPPTLIFTDNFLTLLDQKLLPHEVVYEKQEDIRQVWQSIYTLTVRGAPAIGVAAAYGSLTGLWEKRSMGIKAFKKLFISQANYLSTARPTAVNLSRSMDIMLAHVNTSDAKTSEILYDELVALAQQIHNEDIGLCMSIGEYGADLIGPGISVLTHCNAGALATTGMGTALAPIYVARERGLRLKVYVDETRPLLQGARLTAWELHRSGIDATLICDNMAADLMSRKLVDLVIVGCDRVAANGDTANKIGTLGVAVLAKHYGIPFYVACPSSTIDFSIASGEDIPIELRNPDEVLQFAGVKSAEQAVDVYNPSFDVTPGELISAFITEKGIIGPQSFEEYLL